MYLCSRLKMSVVFQIRESVVLYELYGCICVSRLESLWYYILVFLLKIVEARI